MSVKPIIESFINHHDYERTFDALAKDGWLETKNYYAKTEAQKENTKEHVSQYLLVP